MDSGLRRNDTERGRVQSKREMLKMGMGFLIFASGDGWNPC
jgi:hypothetical protein